MKKPIIGVVSKNHTVKEFYNWSWQRISDSVRYSINKNGGIALGILPQTLRTSFNKEDEHEYFNLTNEEIVDILVLLNKCDGIILQGGISSHNYEEFIAKYCYENNIPLLGICAGQNNIIRALGGKTKKVENLDVHDRPDLIYAHECIITDKSSKFFSIVNEEKFSVNSVHSYQADIAPECLSVVAVSNDNQIEVVEAKDKTFYIGVKYHPELLVDKDEIQNNIFKSLIDICKNV